MREPNGRLFLISSAQLINLGSPSPCKSNRSRYRLQPHAARSRHISWVSSPPQRRLLFSGFTSNSLYREAQVDNNFRAAIRRPPRYSELSQGCLISARLPSPLSMVTLMAPPFSS